ncbi:MAG TPA: hypothetical protein VJ654_16585 [Noviherbaspirillum sp.]|nr:hypothetical protein [Noviherbaspirillum sp.]
MFKRKARRTAAAVRIAIAIVPLAACDGNIKNAATKQAEFFSSGGPMQSRPVADFVSAAQVTSIEHHHFNIYTSYHAAFDGSQALRLEEGFGVPSNDHTNPRISLDGGSLPETLRTCSVRTLLLLD